MGVRCHGCWILFYKREGFIMKKIKVSRKGRMCKFPHCRIILSIYNHSSYCNLHQDKMEELSVSKAAK